MPTLQVTSETAAERLADQRAIDSAAERIRVAQITPDAQVVDAGEGLALKKGRKLRRDSLVMPFRLVLTPPKKGGVRPYLRSCRRPEGTTPPLAPDGPRPGGHPTHLSPLPHLSDRHLSLTTRPWIWVDL